jgi:hypothetical protein
MSAQTLRSYFETKGQQRQALDAYFKAWGGPFSVSKEMLDHYDTSQRAFDPLSSAGEAFRDFKKIYELMALFGGIFVKVDSCGENFK